MKNWIIGIDPGNNGGLALLDPSGRLVEHEKMPSTMGDLFNLLCWWKAPDGHVSQAFLEKVGGMPGQGGSAMFNFGRGYGHLEMALFALGIGFVTVTPQKWQRHFQMGATKSHEGKTAWKNRLKEKAQQLYPGERISLATADAILIGRYGHDTSQP